MDGQLFRLFPQRTSLISFNWFKNFSGTIQNAFLHFILIVLLISVILAGFYLFPTLLRYHLSFIHYFLRAFLLIVISPFQTLAMIISLFLTSVLLIYLPILFFFVSIPMLLFPISYFAYQGMEKAERWIRICKCWQTSGILQHIKQLHANS